MKKYYYGQNSIMGLWAQAGFSIYCLFDYMNLAYNLNDVVFFVILSVLCVPFFQEHNGHKGYTKCTKSSMVHTNGQPFNIFMLFI
jgi:hypothetical protein